MSLTLLASVLLSLGALHQSWGALRMLRRDRGHAPDRPAGPDPLELAVPAAAAILAVVETAVLVAHWDGARTAAHDGL
jgi:hypothetical protein